ncbi:leucyl aminopeptidase [Candidatus Giovannonibacteria bacterium]|nr:leucyl aminopeptidase [Candidatus Giovannonibacteria bacterium]
MFEGDEIASQPLFKYLDLPEKEYLRGISKNIVLKEKESKVLILPSEGSDLGRKIILVGLSRREKFSSPKAALATRIAVITAKKERIKQFAFWASPVRSKEKTRDFYEVISANAFMANFEFSKYKSEPANGFSFLEEIQGIYTSVDRDVQKGFERGSIIGEEVNNTRYLANTPGGDMTPQILAEHARKDAKSVGIKITVFEEKQIRELKMGGVLGVSKGSAERPRFIVLEYFNGPKSQKPIVLVGKGVTFDTGGLNLKPETAIYEMHMDMSGGAAVIHAICAAARLKLKKNIVGLIPAVENMPSGSSYHPGDVLRSMSGLSIEVLNTDAEGRIILADALHYAKKYDPRLVVDVATLTGAAAVAVGPRFTGLFTSDKKLEAEFRRLGDETGDLVWPLPLSKDYEDDIKGTFGDWANIGKFRWGGAITAAVFLWQFVKDSKEGEEAYPWVHLDIASRMTTTEGDFLAKGASGAPVRLLTRLLEEY